MDVSTDLRRRKIPRERCGTSNRGCSPRNLCTKPDHTENEKCVSKPAEKAGRIFDVNAIQNEPLRNVPRTTSSFIFNMKCQHFKKKRNRSSQNVTLSKTSRQNATRDPKADKAENERMFLTQPSMLSSHSKPPRQGLSKLVTPSKSTYQYKDSISVDPLRKCKRPKCLGSVKENIIYLHHKYLEFEKSGRYNRDSVPQDDYENPTSSQSGKSTTSCSCNQDSKLQNLPLKSVATSNCVQNSNTTVLDSLRSHEIPEYSPSSNQSCIESRSIRESEERLYKAVKSFLLSLAVHYDCFLLEEMADLTWSMFEESIQLVEFKQGEYIFKEHDKVEAILLIEDGTVQFSHGSRRLADTLGSGSILGWFPLISGSPAAADVICISPRVIAWCLNFESIQHIRNFAEEKASKLSTTGTTIFIEPKYRVKKYLKHLSSLAEMQEIRGDVMSSKSKLDCLERVALIGKGGFGSAFLVRDREIKNDQGGHFCLKQVSKKRISHSHHRALREKNALMETAASPFIVSLIATYQDADSIYFLLDFIQGGDLYSYMNRKGVLPHEHCKFYCANILAGLLHLHEKGFVHRDLKPQNILINRDGYLKICDLGVTFRSPAVVKEPFCETVFAEVINKSLAFVGTIPYMAPELLADIGYGPGIDIWALGVILVEMYCVRHPFDGNTLKNLEDNIRRVETGENVFTPPELMRQPGLEVVEDFAKMMLCKSSERITLEKAKNHAYFDSFDFLALAEQQIPAPYVPEISHAADLSHFLVRTEVKEDATKPYSGNNDIFKNFS